MFACLENFVTNLIHACLVLSVHNCKMRHLLAVFRTVILKITHMLIKHRALWDGVTVEEQRSVVAKILSMD